MKQKTNFLRLCIVALGLLLSINAVAQRGQRSQVTPAQREARMVDQYTKKLRLTTEQTTNLHRIASQNTTAMQQLRTNKNLNRQDRRNKLNDLHQQREKEIKALLTPEQQKTYDDWQKERTARQAQRRTERQGEKTDR